MSHTKYQGQYANAQDAELSHEARYILKTARIDLDAFLALDGEQRAARWRQWDHGAKFQAVAQMLTRKYGDWFDPELVEEAISRWDAKWEVAGSATDLPIPPAAELLEEVKERHELAQQRGDIASARQLDRVRLSLIRGVRLAWCLGDLLIQSVNTPGAVYSVSGRRCTCPSGAAGRSSCWHIVIYELLIDQQEERAAEADDVLIIERGTALGQRLALARRQLVEAV